MVENARILIVDDDENIRKVLKTILEEEGYAVDEAEDAKKAIEKSRRNVYNLALIDIRLPDMEGIELLTKDEGHSAENAENNYNWLSDASERHRSR
jgi:two-component system response regulator ResD